MKDHFSAFIALIFLYSALVSQSFVTERSIRLKSTGVTAHQRQSAATTSEYVIDAKSIKDGSLVEYTSAKGSKRLAIVSKRVGAHLDVLNDAKKSFSVPISRVTYHINGTFAFGDLLRLNEILGDLKPIQVERLWEASFGQTNPAICDFQYISKQIFGSTDAVRTFASMKLMSSFGGVFFEPLAVTDNNSADSAAPDVAVKDVVFVPLAPNIVQQNLRSRAALKEFKQRFIKVLRCDVM